MEYSELTGKGYEKVSDLYDSSIRVIKENQAPTGAYIAGPTFSQYRYCWFRDGAYIAYAMDLVGEHGSAGRFYDWAARAVVSRARHVERAIVTAKRGDRPSAENLLHTRYTPGGEVGSDEWPNFQLDGFGTLLWGLAQHASLSGRTLSHEAALAVDLLARYLGAMWRMPCYDCWEEFPDEVHTSTLAAIYGGLTSASGLLADPTQAAIAAGIREFVLDRCVHDSSPRNDGNDGNERNQRSLGKFVGSRLVDASLLHVATPYRLLTPDDPLVHRTVERIETELRRGGGGVRRYVEDSYYGGGEWVLLTAYLGWYHLDRGELERARVLLSWVERAAGEQHMLPEQVAAHLNYPDMLPVWEERWGPSACPLLWSHAAYLTLEHHLSAAVAAEQPPAHRSGLSPDASSGTSPGSLH